MSGPIKVDYRFISRALPENTFQLVRFDGQEGVNQCYRFDLYLAAQTPDIDLEQVLASPATFVIIRADGSEVPFSGILSEFEQLQRFGDTVFYRAFLAPRLWWLTMTRHNQVFLNMTIPEILTEVLIDGGLTSRDFEFRLQKEYKRRWEFVCQYGESHFHFVSRWMEREGMYFFFEQGPSGERVIITDTRIVHGPMPQASRLIFAPPSGLEGEHEGEAISSFICHQKRMPKTVVLKDYNYRKPSLDLTCQAEVSAQGTGEVFLYGEHFRDPEEGRDLANIRSQEILCGQKRFFGESAVPFLRPGYCFDLEDHYRSDFNARYVTLEVQHRGFKADFMKAGFSILPAAMENQPRYANTFTALPARVQFRPERLTPKPTFHGSMTAKIDAAGSGQYAELDEQGRYKVILPFDRSGRKDGKASAWLRMAQPYAGQGHGMHFPLHKGTEVLLTFIDGDPDRPIISAAVPNPQTTSPVTSTNQTMSQINTAGGNRIAIEDQEGGQRILLHSPGANTWVRLGTPNDPGDEDNNNGGNKDKNEPYVKKGKESFKETGYAVSTEGPFELRVGGVKLETILGGLENHLLLGNELSVTMGAVEEFVFGSTGEWILPSSSIFAIEEFKSVTNIVENSVSKVESCTNRTEIDLAVEELKDSLATLSNKETKIVNKITKVYNNEIVQTVDTTALKLQLTEMVDKKVNTVNEEIGSINTKITGVQKDISTVQQEVKSVDTKISEAKTEVKNVVGTIIAQAGTELKSVKGSAIKKAGTILFNQGSLIMNN